MASLMKRAINFFLVIFLSVLLCSFIILFSFTQSMKPQTIKPILEGLFKLSIPPDADLNISYQNFKEACRKENFIELPLDEENRESMTLDCNKLRNSKPSELGGLLAESMFDELYYKKYDCIFLGCLKNALNSPFLLSNASNALLANIGYITLALFFILVLAFSPILGIRSITSIFLVNGISFFLFFIRKNIIDIISQTNQLKQFSPLFSAFIYYFSILSMVSLGIAIALFLIPRILKSKPARQKKKKR